MYEYLRGMLIGVSSGHCVLDIQGIGYKIAIPSNLQPRLTQIGSTITLYTSQVIRETAHTLYGFLDTQSRDLFETLLSCSGIGPKSALGMLGALELEQLMHAIEKRDALFLARAPGIGKKTAQRLIVDLYGKFSNVIFSAQHSSSDALAALVNLGFSHSGAQKAIENALKELPEKHALADLITTSLKFPRK